MHGLQRRPNSRNLRRPPCKVDVVGCVVARYSRHACMDKCMILQTILINFYYKHFVGIHAKLRQTYMCQINFDSILDFLIWILYYYISLRLLNAHILYTYLNIYVFRLLKFILKKDCPLYLEVHI